MRSGSSGQIYCNRETRDWFGTVDPAIVGNGQSLLLDGDLPKRDWFTADRSSRLSELDGQIHTVVPRGPIGLHPPLVAQLAQHGIHLHFYGDFHHAVSRTWVEEVRRLAPEHFHLYPQVDQERWVAEFSRYDAGWLHLHQSVNEGDVRRATWPDLNYPARLATLAAAGVPLVQWDNQGSLVAMQSVARELDLGLVFTDGGQLAEQLRAEARMAQLRENVWRQFERFTFDDHADRLVAFFRDVIAHRSAPGAPTASCRGPA